MTQAAAAVVRKEIVVGPQWQIESEPENTSEVEVRFVADGSDRTRVELEHRNIDRHGLGGKGSLTPWTATPGGRCTWPGTQPSSTTAPEPRHVTMPNGHGRWPGRSSRSAMAAVNARIRCVPAVSPFSKSAPSTAIELVTWATQTTRRLVAAA